MATGFSPLISCALLADHGRNVYAYLLAEYGAETFDFISIQLYEGWSTANWEISENGVDPSDYVTNFVTSVLAGWEVAFDADPALGLPRSAINISRPQLVVGLANGWAAPPPSKFLLIWPEAIGVAWRQLQERGSAPRGFMYWNVKDEGMVVEGTERALWLTRELRAELHPSVQPAAAADSLPSAAAPLPLLPLRVAANGSWPDPENAASVAPNFHHGDIRASVSVAAADIDAGQTATAQVFWRRRDPNLTLKLPVVTNAEGERMKLLSAHLESVCGVLRFATDGPGVYHVYYLPYVQSGGGAHLHFHWWNCTETEDRGCVTSARVGEPAPAVTVRRTAEPSQCEGVTGGATVVALESRDAFHAFSEMEMVAAPSEVAAVVGASRAPFSVFAESAAHPVRMFDHLPARWARNGTQMLSATASPGTFFVFQIGVFAHGGALPSVSLDFGTGLSGQSGAIEPGAFRCFNLGGTDAEGQPLRKVVAVAPGQVAALWVGIDLPTTAAGLLTGSISVGALGHAQSITLALTVKGAAVPDHGAADLYRMTRLRWLDSTLGSNASDITPPFAPVEVNAVDRTGLSISLLHKQVRVGLDGLPTSVRNAMPRIRRGKAVSPVTELLESLEFRLLSGQAAIPMAVVSPAKVTQESGEGAGWQATLHNAQSGVTATVRGLLEYDSYLEMNVTLTFEEPLELDDVQLRLTPAEGIRRFMFGLSGNSGTESGLWSPLSWRWSNTTGDNLVWAGIPAGGIFLKLKGEGTAWNNPLYSRDFPVVPFVPRSWGGASPQTRPGGINVTTDSIVAFCGPRKLAAGESLSFLFDLAFTPSKPVDMRIHYSQRYLQLGYGGTPYLPAAEVASRGATVMTLHQGISELVDGGMVNPYINCQPRLDCLVSVLTCVRPR